MGFLDFLKRLKNDIVDPGQHAEKEQMKQPAYPQNLQKKDADKEVLPAVDNEVAVPLTGTDIRQEAFTDQVAGQEEKNISASSAFADVPSTGSMEDDTTANPSLHKEDNETLLRKALEEEQALLEEQLALRAAQVKTAEKKQDVMQDNQNKQENETQPSYLGNLEHTALIDRLLRVPRDERDDEWVGQFLSHVATASFVCGDPQVIQGPDNFPYFQIFIPEANKPFQCYVLEHMLDDFLLENGLGVALEPKGGQVEWVLTYGDLLHYSVYRTFAIPKDHVFGKAKEGDEVIQQDEQVLVGAPSEQILPIPARAVIKSFLMAQGIKEPKVCIIDRSAYGKGQDLVFNLVPEHFESQAHYRAIMQALSWFLPRYYSYIGAQEQTFGEHFLPL